MGLRRARHQLQRHAVALSNLTRWSTLAKVGSTPAMKLTVFVPLIGLFLLFNQAVESALLWPTFFLKDLRLPSDTALPGQNLYFTYFGLCLLGLGSVLYAAFCPREISDQPNIGRYVVDTPSAGSSVIAKDDFRTVLDLRFAKQLIEPGLIEKPRLDYPAELEGDFHNLMEELYSAAEVSDVDGMPEVMLASGYLDYTQLAIRVWHNIRAEWAFTLPFYNVAPKFARDLAFLKFKSLDYTRFAIRNMVAAIYAIGFVLVLKPTLHVFLLLITAWMR